MTSSPEFIPIARPSFDDAEWEAMRRPLASGWVVQGPEVAVLEAEFGGFVKAPYACAVSNGTAALHLALKAVGVEEDDEVITVSHSFIATASSVRYCGAVPVFVDIEPETFNMNPRRIARLISPRTAAILCVHQMGMPCDLSAILDIARAHRLPVVEDAACAVGSAVRLDGGDWERIGRPHGDVATFSFHPRKLLTCGDGGMITTRDAEIDARVRRWRNHSITPRSEPGAVAPYFPDLGYNYRLTDIQAAMARVQLGKLPAMLERRAAQVERYRALLADLEEVTLPHSPEWARSNWQSFCLRLDEDIDRDAVILAMKADGVGTRPGISCAHREPAYVGEPWACGPKRDRSRAHLELEESELAQDQGLSLPLFDALTEAQQERVAAALVRALATR